MHIFYPLIMTCLLPEFTKVSPFVLTLLNPWSLKLCFVAGVEIHDKGLDYISFSKRSQRLKEAIKLSYFIKYQTSAKIIVPVHFTNCIAYVKPFMRYPTGISKHILRYKTNFY